MQIYAITLLLLSGSGLLTLSITFFAFYFVLILVLTVAAILLTYYAQDSELVLPGTIIMKIVTKSLLIPSSCNPPHILHVRHLPRHRSPANFLNRPDKARTGFTDHVRLGAVSDVRRIQQSCSGQAWRRWTRLSCTGEVLSSNILTEKGWTGTKKEPAPGSISGKAGR